MPEGWLAIAPPQHAPVLLPPCSAFLGRAPLLIVLGCRPYSGRPRLVVSASCSHKALLSPSSSGYTLASSSPLSPCSLMLCRACSCAQRAQPAPCRVPAELLRTAPYRASCSYAPRSRVAFPARRSSLRAQVLCWARAKLSIRHRIACSLSVPTKFPRRAFWHRLLPISP